MLSCVNACYLRHLGVSTNECLGYCDRTGVSGCDLFVKDAHFELCWNRDVRGSDCGAVKKSDCELGCTSYPELEEKGFWGKWSQCVETSPNSCTRSRNRVCPTEGVRCWGNGPSHEKESCACPPPPAERSFSFLAWDSRCKLEKDNARSYVVIKAAFPDSEQACEQFCYDWDECIAFS